MKNDTLPIAELFHSIQGEGVFAGTQMCFVRLAGCNVGRYGVAKPSTFICLDDVEPYKHKANSICKTFDGQEFLCDTDYRIKQQLTVDEILKQCWEEHLCITGGEPFLHDLLPLVDAAEALGLEVHIETSGTKPISPDIGMSAYITCSPKAGFIPTNAHYVSQWKFVIGPDTNTDNILKFLEEVGPLKDQLVYFQPVGNINSVDMAMAARCLQLMKEVPEARLSLQLHKLLGLR